MFSFDTFVANEVAGKILLDAIINDEDAAVRFWKSCLYLDEKHNVRITASSVEFYYFINFIGAAPRARKFKLIKLFLLPIIWHRERKIATAAHDLRLKFEFKFPQISSRICM